MSRSTNESLTGPEKTPNIWDQKRLLTYNRSYATVSMPSHSLHIVRSFTWLVLMDWFAKLFPCQETYCTILKLPQKQYHLYPFHQPHGKILPTATSQLKIFTFLDEKKLQKLSGHPVSVTILLGISKKLSHLCRILQRCTTFGVSNTHLSTFSSVKAT